MIHNEILNISGSSNVDENKLLLGNVQQYLPSLLWVELEDKIIIPFICALDQTPLNLIFNDLTLSE